MSAAVIALALQPVSFGVALPDVMLLVAASAAISFVLFDGRMSGVPARRSRTRNPGRVLDVS